MADTEAAAQSPADAGQQAPEAEANLATDPEEKPSTPDAGDAEPIAKPDEKFQG